MKSPVFVCINKALEYIFTFNTVGEKVYQNEVNVSKTEIDLNDKNAGIYFLHFIDGTNTTVQKIMISH